MPLTFLNLFSKGKIGKVEMRNRIVMLPMSTNFPNENGGVTNELIDYYAERAKGGAGLVVIESAGVDFPVGRNGATKLRCDQVNFVPGLSRLVDAIHVNGAKAFIQIQHAGSATGPEKTFGHQPVAPSTVKNSKNEVTARELSVDEVKKIVSEFAKTARYAKEAGFDGVEVHGAHSYLIAQFLSPLCNRRKDEYGGTLLNRARFLLEIINNIRKEVGPNFIISVRINGDEFTEGGLDVQQAKKIAVLLENFTVDILNISSGLKNHANGLSMYNPQGWRTHLAKEIKQAVKIPVIASGGFKDPGFADDVLSKGEADFIGLGRALIADPFWPLKAARGDIGKIRRCISCNVGCAERRISGYRSIKCSLNPDVGQEGHINAFSCISNSKRRVIIIGAGPAGLNAAIEAKKRGHFVEVIEKGNEIGGLIHLASIPYCKEILQNYVDFLRESIKEHDIMIHFNEEATFEKIKSLNPNVIVFATGSRPITPANIPGINNGNVITAHDLLRGKRDLMDKNIIVLGGGAIGCEVADLLAEKNKVTIIEMGDILAARTERINRAALIKRLKDMHVNVMLGTRLEEIGTNKAAVRVKAAVHEIPADVIVLSVGAVPVLPEWAERVHEIGAYYYTIGDAQIPGKLIDAVHQGTALGRRL